jgi:hypothetical protein
MGRFLSRDPAEDQNGMALYVCCNNDPLSCVDYIGLSTIGGIKEIMKDWTDMPSKVADSLCMSINIQAKTEMINYKTERVNGCKFACCPLPATAIAFIAEVLLNKNFPMTYEHKCSAGKVCCGMESVTSTFPQGSGWNFSMETGPHGETGSVSLEGHDITSFLESYGGYKKTSVKTTCRFSGILHLDGKFTISVGNCVAK